MLLKKELVDLEQNQASYINNGKSKKDEKLTFIRDCQKKILTSRSGNG